VAKDGGGPSEIKKHLNKAHVFFNLTQIWKTQSIGWNRRRVVASTFVLM